MPSATTTSVWKRPQRRRSSRAGISVATIAAPDCAGACAVTGMLTAMIASFPPRRADMRKSAHMSRAQRSTSEAKWCAADPGPFKSVAVPDQRCTAPLHFALHRIRDTFNLAPIRFRGDDIVARDLARSRRLNQASLHRRLRHAGPRDERILGSVLERLIRRQHHRGRAHPMMCGIDPGRRDPFLHPCLGRAHQAVARHDDAVVGGDQVLLGAVADRSHALLQRGVLDRKAGDAAEGPAGFLRRTIDQIVVVLVGERPVAAGHVLAVHARAIAHGIDLAPRERAYGVKVVAPRPAVLDAMRDPEVAVDRMIAARRYRAHPAAPRPRNRAACRRGYTRCPWRP